MFAKPRWFYLRRCIGQVGNPHVSLMQVKTDGTLPSNSGQDSTCDARESLEEIHALLQAVFLFDSLQSFSVRCFLKMKLAWIGRQRCAEEYLIWNNVVRIIGYFEIRSQVVSEDGVSLGKKDIWPDQRCDRNVQGCGAVKVQVSYQVSMNFKAAHARRALISVKCLLGFKQPMIQHQSPVSIHSKSLVLGLEKIIIWFVRFAE